MAEYQIEKKYTIEEDASGSLYFFSAAKKDSPHNPQIILDYINPQVRDKLRKSREVIVVESLIGNIKDSYYTALRIVDKIPLDWAKLGLTTWEEAALQ